MICVAAYCRVSTDHQDQSNSFDAQMRFFREYIQNHSEWSLYNIYADEAITGTSTKKRTAFHRMIADAGEGKFQLILTKEVSRFSRNILDTISYTRKLRSMGIGVIFLTDGINTLDPDAELRLSIMGSIAQEESRRTSCRVVWGQMRQMERGVVFGPSLLGYDVKDGKISINPQGARIVQLIFHKYAVEQLGISQIADFLAREGYRTYTGKTQWRTGTLVKILRNEKYAGDLIQKKSYTPDYLTHEKRQNKGQVPYIIQRNHHPPIVCRSIWEKAQARLTRSNKHAAGHDGYSDLHLFSGRIQCGQCGKYFVARYKYSKDGTKLLRWGCPGSLRGGEQRCDVGKLLRDDDARAMVKSVLYGLQLDTKRIIDALMELITLSVQSEKPEAGRDLQRQRSELARIEKKKENLLDSYLSREISTEEWKAMQEKYTNQINEIKKIIGILEAEIHHISQPQLDADRAASTMRAILSGAEESEILYRTLLESITVYKDSHMDLRLKGLVHVFRFTG